MKLPKQNTSISLKINSLQLDIEIKNQELQSQKLHYISDINRHLEKVDRYKIMVTELEDKKLKQSNKIWSIIKKLNEVQYHNVKLENKVSILQNVLQLSNWSLHKLVAGNSKLDEILGAKLVRQKHQGLGFNNHMPTPMSDLVHLK